MARAAKRLGAPYDPTIYPSDDRMGEGSLQRFISELARRQIEGYLASLGQTAFVGANQFIYWRQFDPSRRLDPSVFVLPGVRPGIKIDSWKVWEREGLAPSFALEIVSQDWEKDYRDSPEPYAELGVRELMIFDPEWAARPHERLRWQVYRWLVRRGFVRVEANHDDRARSKVLGCWLRAVGDDLDSLRLRLAVGPQGERLLPTAGEALARAEQTLRAEREARAAEREARAAAREARARAERTLQLESEARARAEQTLQAEREARAAEREALAAEREARARAEAELRRLRGELEGPGRPKR
ncbi:MAG TPA: Uma2 family endonuclease [Polyangiaceae bacterium]|nr:Uma2 family endonuclease [Polyangiaceae bacterium]